MSALTEAAIGHVIKRNRYRRNPMIERKDGWVYFLLSPTIRRMKVGRTKRNPRERVCALQVGAPEKLILLGVVWSEDWLLEEFIHAHIWDHRAHGEWFAWPECAANLKHCFSKWTERSIYMSGDSINGEEFTRLRELAPDSWLSKLTTASPHNRPA